VVCQTDHDRDGQEGQDEDDVKGDREPHARVKGNQANRMARDRRQWLRPLARAYPPFYANVTLAIIASLGAVAADVALFDLLRGDG
jgi:hypothetical protein